MNQESRTKNDFVKYLIFIFGLLLPTQLGKHFWPSWSYVIGIRVDYLSPTVYVTDIIAVLIIGVWIWERISLSRIKNLNSNFGFRTSIFPFFLLFLAVGIFFSGNPFAGWYEFLKFLEFTALGFALRFFFTEDNVHLGGSRMDFPQVDVGASGFQWFLLGQAVSVLYESILVIWQFFLQRSVGGIWYFLGERTFSPQTPGIANMSLGGELMLRPYGTFSHPNVLAAYLLIALVCLTKLKIFPRSRITLRVTNLIKIIIFILGSFALFLTFSRSVIFLWIIFVCIFLWRKLNAKRPMIYAIFFLVLFPLLIISPIRERFLLNTFSDESIAMRVELLKASLLMIKRNPLLGLGLANFFLALPQFSSIIFRTNYIQPVHNIFLLVASETGIPGLIFFLWFLSITARRGHGSPRLNPDLIGVNRSSWFTVQGLSFIAFIFLGNVDHYFLTLQQGQLLTTLIFAICWAEI